MRSDSPPFIYDFTPRYASCGFTMTATVCSPSSRIANSSENLPFGFGENARRSEVKTFPFCHCLFSSLHSKSSLRRTWRHFNYVSLAINHTQSWKSSPPHPGSQRVEKHFAFPPPRVLVSDLPIDHLSELLDIPIYF